MLSRRLFLVQSSAVLACGFATSADERPMQNRAAKPLAIPLSPSREFLASLDPKYRDLVSGVMRNPTVTSQHNEDPFFAHPAIYDWLLDHPDRGSVAWRRLKVPCLEINESPVGQFVFKDPNGTEVSWRAVARFADGIVWYATGHVKAAPVLPLVAIKGVAVLKCPRTNVDNRGETATFEPTVNLYLQTDNKAASAVLRVIGPAAPRMAEQGAEQLLLFFSGPSRYIFEHPEDSEKLLGPKK
jgi:hypothetical protein